MKTVDQIIERVDELHLEHDGEEYIVGITVEELKSLTDELSLTRGMLASVEIKHIREKQLADAIYADAMLQQDKFKVIERV